MTGATHCIEQFKRVSDGKEYSSLLLPIEELKQNLKHTTGDLKTIAVWKIKFKTNPQ